jgi:signal transduction histidine kinase
MLTTLMQIKNDLRQRVFLGMLVVACISGIVCAVVIYLAYEQIEERILDTLMSLEQEELLRLLNENRDAALPQSASRHFYLQSRHKEMPIPPAFARLSQGMHHDVPLNGRYYNVAVQRLGADRAFITFDTTFIERKERLLLTFILLGTALTPLVAIVVGSWLSGKIIAPVRSLAEQVTLLDPKEGNARLTPNFRGYEVEAIAQALDRYMERVDRLVKREQSFTAAVSHELRSPLAIMTTSAELLDGDPRVPAPLRETINRMQYAIRDMSDSITAMLFLAREPEGSGSAIMAETAMHELLPRIIDEYGHLTNCAVSLKLEANDRLVVPAPESHVSIIIGNLLRNAISFTKTGQITASLRGQRLTIVDTGCGIPPEELTHIFKYHYRGANSQGYGLGLHTAKNLCDRHGWRLKITSVPDEGTVAVIEF